MANSLLMKMLSWVNGQLLKVFSTPKKNLHQNSMGVVRVTFNLPIKSKNSAFSSSHFPIVLLHWSRMYSFSNPLTEILTLSSVAMLRLSTM